MTISLITIFLILVFSLCTTFIKKFRIKNKELVELIQTLIITVFGIFLGLQLSIWNEENEEKKRLTLRLQNLQDESQQLINIMSTYNWDLNEIQVDSSQVFQQTLDKNPFPKSLILPILINSNSVSKYTSSKFLVALTQIKRNLDNFHHFSKSDMDYENSFIVVNGIIHQIETLVQYIEIEKEYLRGEIDDDEAFEKYYNTIVAEGIKNNFLNNNFKKK